MKKLMVAAAAGLLAASLAACAQRDGSVDVDVDEYRYSCHDKDGKFVKLDDDCHDDKLFTAPPKPVPYGGFRPSKTATVKPPVVRTTRR